VSNLKFLREDEKLRLVGELYKENSETNLLDKFKSFISILDKKRNIEISNYLNEWKTI